MYSSTEITSTDSVIGEQNHYAEKHAKAQISGRGVGMHPPVAVLQDAVPSMPGRHYGLTPPHLPGLEGLRPAELRDEQHEIRNS
jgi:hypothetical protein